MLHLMNTHGAAVGETGFETDRGVFLGRGRDPGVPVSLDPGNPALSNTAGSVLDPCVAVRKRVNVEPGQSVTVDVITGCSPDRAKAVQLLDKYADRRLSDRVADLAWTHSNVVLQQLNISEADAQLFGRLAGSIVYATPLRRAAGETIAQNAQNQSDLWGYGISGDLPVVLVRVADPARLTLVRQLVQAHAYWRRKGLLTELVVWVEQDGGYRDQTIKAVEDLTAACGEGSLLRRPGGIFPLKLEQLPEADRTLIQAVARVIVSDAAGTLEEQIDRRARKESPARFVPRRRQVPAVSTAPFVPPQDLLFFNGLGGFTRDGREYITTTSEGHVTPAPWINVIANAHFGTIVTESGGSYTWCENAHEYRLTPWYNDPVTDQSGECLYLRDEASGEIWSPTPLPARGPFPYTTHHGFGYTRFEYDHKGLRSRLTVFVAPDAPVKFYRLEIENDTGGPARVSATAYVEWVLGELRHKSAPQVVTESDPATGAVLARNRYNADFARRVSFLHATEQDRTVTGDRREFMGRNGSPTFPAAMAAETLSGTVGAGLDPCGAMRVVLDLDEGETRTLTFTMGSGQNTADAKALAARFGTDSACEAAERQMYDYWLDTLGGLRVETPDHGLDVLVNGWLPYQVLSCRYWGRSGFYQSGGAYGFRDQLQDVAALLHVAPEYIREHLLRAAAHQFDRGDVLHWWHPPKGAGVRTHFSDDYLWMPWVAARYVTGTGDTGILDEQVPFLVGPDVPDDTESIYQTFGHADEPGTLYDHCVRAIRNATTIRGYGAHGLPLIGCGDWNDGMNLIGEHGRGESVWMAFFLMTVVRDFLPVAELRGDDVFVEECRATIEQMRAAVEAEAWDGLWYRRAYFDDGTPLGSSANTECQIDSLPQSWSVLAGQTDPERSKQAMEAVDRQLVRRDAGLIQLFDPPFDKCEVDPGYIKGYLPGVRENGGQYTHAAVWTVMAFAEMGDARRAWELFNLINPVRHGDRAEVIGRYKVEPYVVAADVYGVHPHVGRGGWTWYTGSAGWLYRLAVEHLLGLRLKVDELEIRPLLPEHWPGFAVEYRHKGTPHHIRVNGNGRAIQSVTIDGQKQPEPRLILRVDGRPHEVVVELAPREAQ